MKKLFKHLVMSLLLVVAFSSQAFAAKPIYGKVVDIMGGAPVQWTLYAQEAGNDTYTVVFTGAIRSGFHGYSLNDPYSAPSFTFKNGKKIGGMSEPLKGKMHSHTDEFGDVVKMYKGQMMFVQNIQVAPNTKVTGEISANICTDATNQCQQCAFDFEITLAPSVEEAAAPAVEQKKEETTEPAAPATEETKAEEAAPASVEEAAPATEEGAIVATETTQTNKLDWTSILSAIIWGFAALLTPCVFPMVPMTVSFFIKGSGSKAQGRFRATMYGIFIIALYVLPIAALILITRFTGGEGVTEDIFNWLSTHWIPNLIFFAIFMIFAASFFGAFEITMPSKLVNKSDAGAEKGGLLGIFFMALTLVLVSFSCTGPIVGTVIISSTSGGFRELFQPLQEQLLLRLRGLFLRFFRSGRKLQS